MYQIPKLLQFPGFFHEFSTKEDGNMANVILGKEVNSKKTLENRTRFLDKLGVDIEKCICMWVLGKDGVKVVKRQWVGASMRDYKFAVKIDALITNQKGLYLFLLTADCAPVILYDPVKSVVGLIHVGWKGADLNIVKKVIKSLSSKFKSNPKNLIAAIGPAARKHSFIKKDPSQKNDPKWKPFLEKVGPAKYKVDFVGLCKKQLVEAGIEEKNIFDSGIDTVGDKRFYSHYLDGKKHLSVQGRFACVVGLK